MNIEYNNGSDPLGLCQYLLNPKKQRDENDNPIISTNMSGRDAEELTEEFRFSHKTNPNVKITMRHLAVSFQPGEKVSQEKFARIFKRIYELTGHQDCLYVNAKHYDKEEKLEVEHGHGAVSAVDKNGKWVDDAYIVTRLKYGLGGEKSVQEQIEEEFNLQPYTFRPERERNNLPTGEYRMKQRLSIEQTPTEKLWEQIREATEDKPTFAVMAARLKTREVGVRFKEIDGKVIGISFEIDGALRKGKDLGRQYSFIGLQRNDFVQQYDDSQPQQLRDIQKASPDECQRFLDTHFEQYQQLEHDRLHQEHIFNGKRPKYGSAQWKRARAILSYLEDRMNEVEKTELEDNWLSAKWNEETQQIIVVEKEKPNQVLLQGETRNESDWDILHADISLEHWQHFQRGIKETKIAQEQMQYQSLLRSTNNQSQEHIGIELE
ncbi:relaxase/mobilization nuclease domain-containing protein [Oscillatoria sp. FACHB-1407]|uniref:relaxase/mobilization nuclease domain-containing protein n=1 Tax=Oscillatoria sp. FACHB-1407 TaxID=2692847 RepID=UPI00168577B3|nr:relaxase/mobilization nuclease domain-containing protein [Oscillatoria sp. FACHB-1407]MBD2465614.1 relaxase/mobilization nuclease domain-containing protein [Oscillatoria sp. FACHB-1407]